MSRVALTKNRSGDKMFYYVHFLWDLPNKNYNPDVSFDTSGDMFRSPASLSVQLGSVADGTDHLVVSDSLSTCWDHLVFGQTVQQEEFTSRLPRFYEAIRVAEARFEAKIRLDLRELQRWLDNRTSGASILIERQITALQRLRGLKLHFLNSWYGASWTHAFESGTDRSELIPSDHEPINSP